MDSSSSFCQKNPVNKQDKRFKARKITRFTTEELEVFQKVFEKEPYPPGSEITSLATKFKESSNRIREWFRAQRKKDFLSAKKITKRKKVFENSEIKILWECYRNNKYPSQEEFNEIALDLSCQVKNVKNWYFYRRRHSYKNIQNSSCEYQKQAKTTENNCKSNSGSNNLASTSNSSDLTLHEIENFETFLTSSNSNSIANERQNNKPKGNKMEFQNPKNQSTPQIPTFHNNQSAFSYVLMPTNPLNQQHFQQGMPMQYGNFQQNLNALWAFNNANGTHYMSNLFSQPQMMPFPGNLQFNNFRR